VSNMPVSGSLCRVYTLLHAVLSSSVQVRSDSSVVMQHVISMPQTSAKFAMSLGLVFRLNASHYIQASDCHLQPVRSSSQANALATENSGSTSQQHAKGLYLYNTMSRSRRLFTPRQDVGNRVSMYVCGVTVYDLSHIGHARVYVSFDVLYRLLMSLGYDVQYVRNFTDIDDKIIARAAQTGQDPMALSAQFIEEFHKDLALLECKPPTLEPKATEHVADMVDIILRIMENGSAYEVGGDVFFDIQSINGYGRLSGQKLDASLAGAIMQPVSAVS
jgi:cysteinyl-tRNA synthetase